MYEKAADLYQPEAMCAVSISISILIMAEFNLRYLETIPKDKINKIHEGMYSAMWDHLENLANMDFVTPFLIFHINQAEKFNIRSLNKTIKYIMKKREKGETIELKYSGTLQICDYDSCEISAKYLFRIYSCNVCLNKKYCSERCEF